MEFPIFKTKIKGLSKSFNLSNPEERKKYFELKAGEEIKKIKKYLKDNAFIAYLLGKKNSGKGTYSKLFIEIFGSERVGHISVGDIVRSVHIEMADKKKKKELFDFLKNNYRGYISIEEAIDALLGRNTKTLLPTEFILALVKREITRIGKKAIFIDGFPRDLDQISYSLYFRDLIDYRDDPDFFVLIDVPESVINERMKYRSICPKCQTSRSLKLLPTSYVEYDEKNKSFYLLCDNSACEKAKMAPKEGDELGIEAIRDRIEMDGKLAKLAFSLYGVPKILLRNSIPQNLADQYVDKYEITPEYVYKWNPKSKKTEISEKPWIVADNEGNPSYSLLAPPVVVAMIKKIAETLNL